MSQLTDPAALPPPPPPRRGISCAGALVLVALIIAAVATFVIWRVETVSTEAARNIQRSLGEIFKTDPRVTVNDRIVVERTTPIMELAVVTRDVLVEREREHAWMGSTKRLKLRGTYKVRAGFDLTQPFDVDVVDRHVTIRMPAPKILSVEQLSAEVLQSEQGLWNKIRPEEVGTELSRLPAEGQKQAEAAGLKEEALQTLRQQIQEKLGPGYQVEIILRDLPPPQG